MTQWRIQDEIRFCFPSLTELRSFCNLIELLSPCKQTGVILKDAFCGVLDQISINTAYVEKADNSPLMCESCIMVAEMCRCCGSGVPAGSWTPGWAGLWFPNLPAAGWTFRLRFWAAAPQNRQKRRIRTHNFMFTNLVWGSLLSSRCFFKSLAPPSSDGADASPAASRSPADTHLSKTHRPLFQAEETHDVRDVAVPSLLICSACGPEWTWSGSSSGPGHVLTLNCPSVQSGSHVWKPIGGFIRIRIFNLREIFKSLN